MRMNRAEISRSMENPADVLSDREVNEGKIVRSAARRCSCLLRQYPALELFEYTLRVLSYHRLQEHH